jgi:hypothetical protein
MYLYRMVNMGTFTCAFYWNARFKTWTLHPDGATKYDSKQKAQRALRGRVKAGYLNIKLGVCDG